MTTPHAPPPDESHPATRSPWPYPRWIAHRGAGQLAPENTLAAFRVGAECGYRMFECDAKLSADGVVFLLHDDTLDRTTNGQGLGGDRAWVALSRLDAGGWPPLLTSFEPEALQGARETQPELPRGLLLETLWPGWLATAIELGCQAVICDQDLWQASNLAQVHQAGLRTLAYTVNEATSVQRLLALGIDGLITDRVDVFPPA
jgi:glycerophosphoryl diester phosphodiesterase